MVCYDQSSRFRCDLKLSGMRSATLRTHKLLNNTEDAKTAPPVKCQERNNKQESKPRHLKLFSC